MDIQKLREMVGDLHRSLAGAYAEARAESKTFDPDGQWYSHYTGMMEAYDDAAVKAGRLLDWVNEQMEAEKTDAAVKA